MSSFNLILTVRTFSWTCWSFGCSSIQLSILSTKIHFLNKLSRYSTTIISKSLFHAWKESMLRTKWKIPLLLSWRSILHRLKLFVWVFLLLLIKFGIKCSGHRKKMLIKDFHYLRESPKKYNKVFKVFNHLW